jgi:uncharacterized SAM-binding protein YcdF (DUF218 family)
MLEKVLTQLAMPLGTAALCALLGIAALALRREAIAVVLLAAGIGWVWFWSIPGVSHWLRSSLENRYPPVAVAELPSADAIVVLGGGMGVAAPPRRTPDLGAAADRVWHAARLYQAGKAPTILLSGGALPWLHARGLETDAMSEFLRDLGVPRDRLILEQRGNTTRGNALETKRLIDAAGMARILLVTSALHMARADASFRAVGIEAIPAATDHEILIASAPTWLDWLPDAGALDGSSRAVKEYLGLWVYRLRGWATASLRSG